MPSQPTIQNVSSSYVVKVLMSQPYGTYIFRARASNDDIISSIQLNKRSSTSIPQRYVVLSVRVDSTQYTSPVMNYRLTLSEQNPVQLLEQYYAQKKRLIRLPKLTHELILPLGNPNWILDPRQFHDIEFTKGRLGGKNNAGLSEAIWQRPNQDDVKIFIKRLDRNTSYFNNELSLLPQLCFFSIISFYGHYSDSNYNYLVFAHGGKSLQSVCPMHAQGNESNMRRIAKIAFQISNAMLYLEKKNIVHRDLTAGNVLIDNYGFIRLVDFGHAIQKEEGKNNLSRSLTNDGADRFQLRFLAPECISPHDQKQLYASFSSKSDVWSFGILLVQLMLARSLQPYPHIKDDLDIPQYVKIDRKMHPRPDDCNLDMYYIMQQCWAYERINRISFTDIRSKMNILVSILT